MLYVLKNTKRSYDCYWNAEKQKFTGLLEATTYDKEVPLPNNDVQIVSFNEIVGRKDKNNG